MRLRPASPQDEEDLVLFTHAAKFTHRHLDWRSSVEWLAYPPFWLMLDDLYPNRILAALACPPDPQDLQPSALPPTHTWLRLFGALSEDLLESSFKQLLEKACAELPRGMTLGVVALHEWVNQLMKANRFEVTQQIVLLEWNGLLPVPHPPAPGVRIRRMELEDIEQVHEIDNLAFEPLWRNSRDEVMRSTVQSSYSTVAELDGRIIGYQISTGEFFAAHLARLAVHPEYMRHSVGYTLVDDLMKYFIHQMQVDRLTVNTQNDNYASQALYKRMCFDLTGQSFPVYTKVL